MFNIGDRVKIKNPSIYIEHAYMNGGNGEGLIIGLKTGYLNIRIKWDNKYIGIYPENDIELIEDNEIIKIKWYKK